MSTHPPRLLIVGLDGATFDLIEPWVRVGELPNLARLIRGGSIGRLASTVPAVTLPAWSSFLTGKNLGKHGIFDFSVHLPESYGLRFVNASDRVGPTFWRLLSQAGRRVCSLWVPATYPPELVNGIVVSGFDSPVARTMDASFVYPAELFGELRNAVGALRLGVLQQFRIGPGWHERALAKLLDGMETKARLAEHLLTRGPWDCFMVVFGESDTVAHHFWMFHDPDSPRRIPGESGVLRDAIRLVYRRLDAIVGRLLALV
ncbi:MAG: alkaline phosphatase family protein, partial [Candidatus Methylomirabilales bacterium]